MPVDLGVLEEHLAAPVVEFNHLYLVLQEETVEAIASSDFVANHFSVRTSTVEADGESWTGTYLTGQSAYLELFAPGGAEGLVQGYGGIAFSTRRLGQLDDIAARLEAVAPGRVHRGLRKRKVEQGEIAWFYYLGIDGPQSPSLSTWLMDVHPAYLDWRGIALGQGDFFDRSAYLKEMQPAAFDDVVEIAVEITAAEEADLRPFLRALGFESAGSAHGVTYRSEAFCLDVSVVADPEYRIRHARCTTTQPVADETELRFGPDARLRAQGGSLVWLFGHEDG